MGQLFSEVRLATDLKDCPFSDWLSKCRKTATVSFHRGFRGLKDRSTQRRINKIHLKSELIVCIRILRNG